jgi:hypothetical protein
MREHIDALARGWTTAGRAGHTEKLATLLAGPRAT